MSGKFLNSLKKVPDTDSLKSFLTDVRISGQSRKFPESKKILDIL